MEVSHGSIVGFTNLAFPAYLSEDRPLQEFISIDILSGHLNWRQVVHVDDSIRSMDVEGFAMLTAETINGQTRATAWDLRTGNALWRQIFGGERWIACNSAGDCALAADRSETENSVRLSSISATGTDFEVDVAFEPLAAAIRGDNAVAIGPCLQSEAAKSCGTAYAVIDRHTGELLLETGVSPRRMDPYIGYNVRFDSGLVIFEGLSSLAAIGETTGDSVWHFELPENSEISGWEWTDETLALASTTGANNPGRIFVLDLPGGYD
jgi:hypothetical protein